MVSNLSELVIFIGDETQLVLRVKEAVEWVATKPEGLEILEECRSLHNKPLEIVTDSTIHNLGYGDHLDSHVVFANPLVSDHMYLHGQDGERIHNGLERFFCHEFKHGSQPNILINSKLYTARRMEIVTKSFPIIPYAAYQRQIDMAKYDNAALKIIFGKMYDKHVGPKALQMTKKMVTKLGEDPIVQEFVARYEVPAIEFENLMMQKYKGEPGRTTDYINSAIYDETIKSTDRNGFIESALAAFRVHVPK